MKPIDAARVRACLAAIISSREIGAARLGQKISGLQRDIDDLEREAPPSDVMMRAEADRSRAARLRHMKTTLRALEEERHHLSLELVGLRRKDQLIADADRKTRKRMDQQRARKLIDE
ncbi:hypothetical protein [Pontivivens nitratireducens]|uniref:Uncharacterized protein n=1 Tax=Pontivivens nitratireducens TaxID=2758038 RepID=A0A6G7VL84_9RHOB|nr:hypothetical protein [Pontibrevibacter nitratireducens]QIK40626.1 hypothetical protein G8E03_07500 [Pontibrevibacter nitratireducens]